MRVLRILPIAMLLLATAAYSAEGPEAAGPTPGPTPKLISGTACVNGSNPVDPTKPCVVELDQFGQLRGRVDDMQNFLQTEVVPIVRAMKQQQQQPAPAAPQPKEKKP